MAARVPWLTEHQLDSTLMARYNPNEFRLVRLRRELHTTYQRLTRGGQLALEESGICYRFQLLNDMLQQIMGAEFYRNWLTTMEHTDRDIREMYTGEYPISPYVIRLYSTLFGIGPDFMLLGNPPCHVDEIVPAWPRGSST